MRVWLLRSLLTLLVVTALAQAAIVAVLWSAPGNRLLAQWVSELLPELELSGLSGNLIDGLSMQARYRDANVDVQLADARLRLEPGCFPRLRLCIDSLAARRLAITVLPAPKPEPDLGPQPLAPVAIPVPLDVGHLWLGDLDVMLAAAGPDTAAQESVFAAREVTLRGGWEGDRVGLQRASLKYRGADWQLQGYIRLRDFFPLQAQVRAQMQQAPPVPVGVVAAQVDGDLRELEVQAASQGEWRLSAQASLSALEPRAPVQARVQLLRPATLVVEEREIILQQGRASATGTWQTLEFDLGLTFLSDLWSGENRATLEGSGRVRWQDRQLVFHDLSLRQGDNRIRAQGALQSTSAGTIEAKLELPHLERLWPTLSGAVSGTATLSGTLEAPDIQGRLQLSQLGFEGGKLALASGRVRFRVAQSGREASSVVLRVQQLRIDGQAGGDLELDLNGTLGGHQLGLQWQHPQRHSLNLGCRGGLTGSPFSTWSGACDRLEAAVQLEPRSTAERWRLADQVALEVDIPAASLSVAPFCLRRQSGVEQPAVLCNREPLVASARSVTGIALNAEHMPWELLQARLPATLKPSGRWQFSASGSIENALPDIDMQLRSESLALAWQAQLPAAGGKAGRGFHVPVTELSARLHLLGTKLDLSGEADTEGFGRYQVQLSVAEKTVSGRVDIDRMRLEPLAPLLSGTAVESVQGRVNADIRIGGSRERPELQGTLSLEEGRVAAEMLPSALENLALRVQFDNRGAQLDGRFTVAGEPGTTRGEFSWAQKGWRGELFVDAEKLVLRPDKNVQLTLVPDLKVTLNPERILLTGKVRVPRARIQLKQLPAQAVSVSPDAVVVGAADEEEPSGPAIVSRINVALGDDVVFRGFGLDTRLTGQLDIRQTNTELLKANGVIRLEQGRYKAYGQALSIQQGDLIFVGDVENPQLRVEAVREEVGDETVVGLRATGPARNPSISLFSRPEMSEQAKLHYLVTGQPPGAAVAGDSSAIAAQTALALGVDTSAGVLEKTAGVLGIENFRVSAEGGENGPQMRLSGYISPNLMVRYGIGVFDAVNSLTLRYRLKGNLYLEATSGQANSLDLLWSFER